MTKKKETETIIQEKETKQLAMSKKMFNGRNVVLDGKLMHPVTKKIITMARCAIQTGDTEFNKLVLTLPEVAETIGMHPKNLYKLFVLDEEAENKSKKENILNELQTARIQFNNGMGHVTYFTESNYDPKTKCLILKFHDEIKEYLLNLGKDNLYFLSTNQDVYHLKKTETMEYLEMIENKINDIELAEKPLKPEQHYEIRVIELSLENLNHRLLLKYNLKTQEGLNKFKRDIKEQNKYINIYTSVKILKCDYDKRGTAATKLILEVQRDIQKNPSYIRKSLPVNSTIDFGDDELNNIFNDYLVIRELDIKKEKDIVKIKALERKLYTLAGRENGRINIENAKEILNNAIIGGWKDLYVPEKKKYDKEEKKVEKRSDNKLQELEQMYLNEE